MTRELVPGAVMKLKLEASFNESKSSTENGSKSVCLDMFEQELDVDLNNLGVKQVSMNPKIALRMEASLSVLRGLNRN